ncbi:hypothetical protein GGI43DRAFT_160132 [Trichoderma evansii]
MAPYQRLRMAPRPVHRLLSLSSRTSQRCIASSAGNTAGITRRLPYLSGNKAPSAATLSPSAGSAQGLLSANPSSLRACHFPSSSATYPASVSYFSSSSSPFPSSLPSTGRLPSRLQQQRSFATTAAAMVATKLDGNSIAKAIRERLGAEIAEKQQKNPRYRPSLRIIQGMAEHAQDSKVGD